MKYGVIEILTIIFYKVEVYFLRFARRLASIVRGVIFHIFSERFFSKSDKIKIMYITDLMEVENGQTSRYRIFNYRQSLKGIAKTAFEIIDNGIYKDRRRIASADIIVLMRLEWSPKVEALLNSANALKIPVVYDIDDIVFLQDYLDQFLRIMPNEYKSNREAFKSKFSMQDHTFNAADFATTSTDFIQNVMTQTGKRAFVIHNGFNQKQLSIAKSVHRDMEKPVRYISYLSGTVTHNIDFLQALPAILKIMYEYPDVILKIVGYLDIDTIPQDLQHRVITLPFMKWTRLLKSSAKDYINIAPLDISNPFCHAKSELKYFEAAIVGVPTVASATDTYKRCITHGVNGMLASNDDEWYTSLKALLDDKNLYHQISKNAYDHVMEHYSPEAIAKEAMDAYQSILELYKMKQ